MFPINLNHLEEIKKLILKKAGLSIATARNCSTIALLVTEKTQMQISLTTVKRVFGFALSNFSPSAYTLNALALYCDFESWHAFVSSQAFPNKSTVTGSFFEDPLLIAFLDVATPVVLLQADTVEMTIIHYNSAYAIATNIVSRPVKGLPFWEAFDPGEAGGSGPTELLEAFHQALYSHKPVQMKPLQYNILSDTSKEMQLSWWDVKVVPVIYADGEKYLLLQVNNITDQLIHRDAIEVAIMRELTLAEDLATSNVKLEVANHQLAELNKHLEQRVFERTQKLFESESKQRKLMDNTPVAIAVLIGPQHVIETANQKIIGYWGKTPKVIGQPLAEALPELEGQPFIEILNQVRSSGIPYINAELEAVLNFNGKLESRYFDMIYQPIQHVAGVTDSIFIVAFDITEHVRARKRVEESESMLRLAVTAARVGIWSFTPAEHMFNHNPMFAEILGWRRHEPMLYEQVISLLLPADRERILAAVSQVMTGDGDYDLSYTIKRHNDGQLIKVRAIGKVTLDASGTRKIFSGVLTEL